MIKPECSPPCAPNIAVPPNVVPSGPSGGLGSSCDTPLFVKACSDAPQVEISDLVLGCALDGNGDAIGVVVLSKVLNEDTGVETQIRTMHPYDGSPAVSPYIGQFGPCNRPCKVEAPIGVVSTWP